MSETSIEWTDKTWNPVRGCSLVSEGCRRCYAMKQAHRFSGPGAAYEGLTELGPDGPRWTGKIRTVPEFLGEPLKWRKPQRVFVNSMSDLFHEDVPDSFIHDVFGVMALAKQHTFQILTKRPERMGRYFETVKTCSGFMNWAIVHNRAMLTAIERGMIEAVSWDLPTWPLPNVWLGVSVEDQKTADERIPLLLQTPAAVRFVSYEPALSAVDFTRLRSPGFNWIDALEGRRHEHPAVSGGWPKLDWIIAGGESGPGARPFSIQWAREVIAQCKAARVPVFVKQLGAFAVERNDRVADEWYYADGSDMDTAALDGDSYRYQGAPVRLLLKDRKGGNPAEWPADLRCRQFPETRNPQPPTVETR